jgi:hypothetical protein
MLIIVSPMLFPISESVRAADQADKAAARASSTQHQASAVRLVGGDRYGRLDLPSLIATHYSGDKSLSNDGHAAEKRRGGSAFPKYLLLLP